MGSKNKSMPETSMLVTLPDNQAHMAAETTQGIDRHGGETTPEHTFESDLQSALIANRIAEARTMVANAESVLAAHGRMEGLEENGLTSAHLAAAKARIAIATGDGAAARAILVRAIETAPKVASLRALMTEVMLADGRAADVRPVLQHLGKSQGGPQRREDERDTETGAMRDTSG